jgi:hypothetical protein
MQHRGREIKSREMNNACAAGDDVGAVWLIHCFASYQVHNQLSNQLKACHSTLWVPHTRLQQLGVQRAGPHCQHQQLLQAHYVRKTSTNPHSTTQLRQQTAHTSQTWRLMHGSDAQWHNVTTQQLTAYSNRLQCCCSSVHWGWHADITCA